MTLDVNLAECGRFGVLKQVAGFAGEDADVFFTALDQGLAVVLTDEICAASRGFVHVGLLFVGVYVESKFMRDEIQADVWLIPAQDQRIISITHA